MLLTKPTTSSKTAYICFQVVCARLAGSPGPVADRTLSHIFDSLSTLLHEARPS